MNTDSLQTSRLIFLLTLISILQITNAQDPGFFLDDWQEKGAEIPDYELVTKPEGAASVNINVDMGQVMKKVPEYIYGNNAVVWGGNMNEHETVMTDINNLNPHVLRWPGGNLSQEYFWNLTKDQRPDDIPDTGLNPWYGVSDDSWQMSTDDYYDLLENTNCTGIICVNYSYARYGTGPDPVAKAAHLAAEWVRYDNGRSKFWEIGNENFGSWEAGYKIDVSKNQDGQPEYISGQLYGQHCKIFIDSMRTAAAEIGVDIKIGVVAYDAETSHADISTVWNEGMMPEVGDLADFLIVHSYFTPYDEDSNISTILNSHPVPEHIMSDLVSDMTEAGKPMIPVAFTEWNIFAVGSMQQVSYINGMHAALVLGEIIINDYGLATRWDLTNGWNAEGNDHGMFSRGGEPGVDHYNPRPVFFYMKYFQDYFGDRMVSSTVTGNSNVIAYASSFSSGEAGLVIVNKSTSDESVSIELDNYEPGAIYYHHTLTGGDDNGDFSRKVFLNGYGTDEEGGGPDDYESVKAKASEVEGGIRVDLPSLSVVCLMVDTLPPLSYVSSRIDSSASVISVQLSEDAFLGPDPAGFEVSLNGSTQLGVTGIVVDSEDASILHIYLDREILVTDTIKLSYSGADIFSLDGTPLVPFTGKLVDNWLPGAAPLITDAFTSDDGSSIQLIFNMDMQVRGASAGSFVLTLIDTTERTIGFSEVKVSGEVPTIILLTPEEPLYSECELFLSYADSSIMSVDSGLLLPFDLLPVTNKGPGSPPELISAEIIDQGFSILITFSKPMNDLSEHDSSFSLRVNDEIRPIDSLQTADSSMTIILSDYLRFSDNVILSYEGTALTSQDRGELKPVEGFQVDNSLPAPAILEIPGRIDADSFSINMEMAVVPCKDAGGGYNLAYGEPGDWIDYEVKVTKTGYYTGTLRIASAFGAEVVIQTPDREMLNQDTVVIPNTGGWQEWRSVPTEIMLLKGRQRVRFVALTTNVNFHWLDLGFDRTLEAAFVSAGTDNTGDTIEIVFDRDMAEPGDGEQYSFGVLADGNSIGVSRVILKDDSLSTLKLALINSLSEDDETITVSYVPGNLLAADNSPVASFSDMPVTNNVVTSIGSQWIQDLSIYPNPASDRITVESSDYIIRGIEVIDSMGKMVASEDFGIPQRRITMDLKVPAGVYLLRIRSYGNTLNSKLLVYEN